MLFFAGCHQINANGEPCSKEIQIPLTESNETFKQEDQ
jgi:hypothetical protein